MGDIRHCGADAPNPEWNAFADRLVSDLGAAIHKEFAAFADRLETTLLSAIPQTVLLAERPATPTRVFVRFDSPQWRAWGKYRPVGLPDGSGSGWWFDSEWPPNHLKVPET
jgi:hypothetical protein